MKLYHVINSLRFGGAENLVVDLLVQFNATVEGKIVIILLDGVETPLKRKLSEHKNINIVSLGTSLYSPNIFIQLIKLLKDADVIHVHLFPALYWVSLTHFFSCNKAKLIFTEHSTENNRRNKLIFKILDRIIYNQFYKIVCISNSTQSNLLKHIGLGYENVCTIINNGVNLKQIDDSIALNRTEIACNKNDIILLQVASFRAAKDQPTVLKALSKLPQNVKLVFIGEGPSLKSCQSLAAKLNIEKRVHFLGIKSNVGDYMKMSDIIVVSSNYEGFGIVAVEGMACRKPVIASNVPGLSEVVINHGVLFEKGNSEELKNKIVQLINNQLLYEQISDKCFLRSRAFNIKLVAQSYLNLYKK
ncbi:glycosyltransferase [Flavobacterium agrisoli]|uniref:Glycosyltransferase n=1 Tax=Flavobacterium agrisoli TaxID=2793066 RepID=A0A934PPD4_9FLAO|nr:glycosyltransferase [Flavobacterium agrisoli]MBK0371287.1 glycosyltransferase [Flavobacterium agrisoli]